MALGHPREPFWYALTAAHREDLHRIGTLRVYEPESVLVHEQDESDFVIVLLDGCVKVSAHAHQGYQAILALRDPGELLGELAGVDGGRRSATLTALTRVETLLLPGDRFHAFLAARPEAAAVMHRVISARLREADRYRAAAGAEPVPRRLATLLLDLGRRYGARSAGGLLIELPLTQPELAGLVLTSPRTLGRVLEQWRIRGWVVTGRRSVLITDQDALRKLALD